MVTNLLSPMVVFEVQPVSMELYKPLGKTNIAGWDIPIFQ